MDVLDDGLADFHEFPHQYERAVNGGIVAPVFSPRGTICFIAEDPVQGSAVWEIDPETGERTVIVQPARLATAMLKVLGPPAYDAGLTLRKFLFVGERCIRFTLEHPWSGGSALDACVVDLELETYQLRKLSEIETEMHLRAIPRHAGRGFFAGDPGPFELPSPNGRWFLGEVGHDLALRAVVDDGVRRLTRDGVNAHEWSIRSVYPWMNGAVWSPDSERVATVRRDARGCELLPVVRWLQTEERVEFKPYSKAGGVFPVSTAAVIDVRSRAIIELTLPGESDQLVFPVGWRHDGAEAYYLATDRRHKYLRLWAVDAFSGAARQVCEETQPTFILGIRHVERFAAVMIIEDDERLLWYSERDGWRHLYLYSTGGREIGRVTSGEFEVLQVIAVDLSRGVVYFTAHSDIARPYDVHICQASLDGSRIDQLTRTSGIHSAILTPSKAHFVDAHVSFETPPTTDLLTTDGTLIATLACTDRRKLEALGPPTVQPFTVKAADGTTDLYGVLYLPPDLDADRSYPVIEFQYGGPQVAVHPPVLSDPFGDRSTRMAAAKLGFIVYSVDGRGTPERGKRFQDVSYGRFHDFHTEDHACVLGQLLEQHRFMDPGRVGVTGHSWGGYNTVRFLLQAPGLHKAGVALAPVYDIDDQNAIAIEPHMGYPQDRPESWAAGSCFAIADKLEASLLMIHGTSDVNATFSATMKMCDAFARAGKHYDLIVLPDADHNFNGPGTYQWRYSRAAMMRYFIDHL